MQITDQEKHNWCVTVKTNGKLIVSINPSRLAGRSFSEADEEIIRTAAHQLLSVIGDQSPDFLQAEKERLEQTLADCDWYWPEDDTSSEAYADSPQEIAENCEVEPGQVFGYARGGVVEVRYYGYLAAADDADNKDRFEVDEATREAAEEKIAAELHRRSALIPSRRS